MDIKDFVETVLLQVNEAVDGAVSKVNRDIRFTNTASSRTIEFDIAVSAESTKSANGKAGIKVLSALEGGGSLSKEVKNSSVSRVKFGLNIDYQTNQEKVATNNVITSSPSYDDGIMGMQF